MMTGHGGLVLTTASPHLNCLKQVAAEGWLLPKGRLTSVDLYAQQWRDSPTLIYLHLRTWMCQVHSDNTSQAGGGRARLN